MKRKTGILLAGLATLGGAVAGAGLLHNRRADRREHLHVTVFSEPGYRGRNQRLTWTGGKREVVPLARVRLPRIGSIKLERLVYHFQPGVQLPNMLLLWHALTDRPDPGDPESGLPSFIAVHQLAGMFSVGEWLPVPEPEARSGVRLWAGRPGSPPAVRDDADPSGARPWHDVLADAPDLGSWSTRTRWLELRYHDRTGSRD
ncbi:hypothetical protein ACFYXS_26270 [Streptomyces sp. NPDC002574]|uniref:hypothetical protein n=1 Tax=Streptomyces sp. NPDC002574 TaxID=3364652 RepID=UPI0036AAE878